MHCGGQITKAITSFCTRLLIIFIVTADVGIASNSPVTIVDKPLAGSNAPITVAAYYYACTHPDPRWDKNKYPGYPKLFSQLNVE